MPITWHNIESRSNADAINLLKASQDSISSGISGLGGVIKERQAYVQDNAKQSFLDKLYSYKTADSLEDAAPEIAAFSESLGGNLDKALARNGVSDQVSKLRNQEIAALDFERSLTDRARADLALEVAPIVDQHKALVAQGKDAEASAFIDTHIGILRASGNLAALRTHAVNAGRQQLEHDREEAAITSRNSLVGRVNDVVNTPGVSSPADAIALFHSLDNSAISGEDLLAANDTLRAAFATRYALSPEQVAGLSAADQQDRDRYAIDQQNSEQLLATVRSQNKINPVFSFGGGDHTVGDAVNLAESRGWDKDTAWFPKGISSINEVITAATEGFKLSMGTDADGKSKLTTNDLTMLPNIIYMAVDELGSDNSWLEADSLDLVILQNRIFSLFQEYKGNTASVLAVSEDELRHYELMKANLAARSAASAARLKDAQAGNIVTQESLAKLRASMPPRPK
jgi:hypothetical protein